MLHWDICSRTVCTRFRRKLHGLWFLWNCESHCHLSQSIKPTSHLYNNCDAGTAQCGYSVFELNKSNKTSSKKRENVICCDAEKLPIRNDVLDGILSTEMIYYINNPQNFLKKIYLIKWTN